MQRTRKIERLPISQRTRDGENILVPPRSTKNKYSYGNGASALLGFTERGVRRCGLVALSPPRHVPVLIFGRDVCGEIGHVSPILVQPSLQSLLTSFSVDGTFGSAFVMVNFLLTFSTRIS